MSVWSSRHWDRRTLLDDIGRGLTGVIMADDISKAAMNMLFFEGVKSYKECCVHKQCAYVVLKLER